MATAESVKGKLQGLIDRSNAATGNSDATLTAAVGSLIAGFGQGGGSGDNPLDYAVSVSRMFYNANFAAGTELVVSFGNKAGFSVSPVNVFDYFCGSTTGLKKVKVSSSLAFTAPYSFSYAFNDCSAEVIDLSGMPQPIRASDIGRAFRSCSNLKEILGELDVSNCSGFNNSFANTYLLETVRFTPGSIKKGISFNVCSNLTDATIQNIIDGLADLTGGTAQTITLHATVGGKLTAAQTAAASAKNWTITY